MRHLRGGGEYITPNISLIDDGKRVYSEKKVNLITFTIGRYEYISEKGMTWGEWINSEYNGKTDEASRLEVYHEYNRIIAKYSGYFVVDAYGEYVVSTDVINSHNYTFKVYTGGGGQA